MLSLLMVWSRKGGWRFPADEEMGTAAGGPIGNEGGLEAGGAACVLDGCTMSRSEGGTVFRSGAIYIGSSPSFSF